jgi:peptidoglycan hydrolase-like protein with peptidoglycan-binding domain
MFTSSAHSAAKNEMRTSLETDVGQTLYRTALLICGLLSCGVLVNLFVMQRAGPQLAMTTPKITKPVERPGRPEMPSASTQHEQTALMNADLVRAIQRELRSNGYLDRAPDGALDMPTRAAIWAWQRQNGLPPTAWPSENVLKALLLGATAETRSPTRQEQEAAAVLLRHVQLILKSRRLGEVAVTGRYDDATRAAIAAFERQQGLPVTGELGATLVQRLENAGRHGR